MNTENLKKKGIITTFYAIIIYLFSWIMHCNIICSHCTRINFYLKETITGNHFFDSIDSINNSPILSPQAVHNPKY